MKIAYLRPTDSEKEVVTAALDGHEVIYAENFNEISNEVLATVEVLSVFVDTAVDAAVLDRAPNVRCIAARSVGFDNIDIKTAHERGIAVCRVPHYGSQTVAEFAFALLFALSRKVYEAQVAMKLEKKVVNQLPYEGFDLGGKTLGVVGTGKIGQRVCAIAHSFGLKVIAADAYPNDVVSQWDVTYVPLETLVSQSDIVSVHVPSLPTTYHMINESMINLMKKTAYLINTSRGEVVDTNALVTALQHQVIAGAGLDVLEGERDLGTPFHVGTEEQKNLRTLNHALMDMPQVIVTPHIGFNTKEAKAEIIQCTIANINAFSIGNPTNCVPV
jgi:D-lactate dehydrogenase